MFTNTADFRKMKNINIPIFAIDFEGSRKIGVVEYAAVAILNGEIADMKTSICAPKIKIPQRDADFFGIDNAEAARHKPFSARVCEFCDMRKSGIFAAHNAAVEDSLLRDALPSPSIVPNFIGGGNNADWSPWIDSCALVKNIFPSLASAKLSAAIDAFGLKPQPDSLAEKFCPPNRKVWHCAPYDALACAIIITHICGLDGFESVTADWLVKYSSAKSENSANLF